MSAQPTIAFDQLSVRLGARTVLDAISLTLDAPGLVVLAGPNGAGKSTLLRTLAGLVEPFTGRCRVDTADIAQWSAPERARMIAYMPQDRAVHWNLPVHTLVALGRLPHRGTSASTPARDTAAVQHALAVADAAALADRPILSLSGGERARILMARALAQEARVLLADEPAAGLDPAHQWALFEALTRVAASGIRVVVVLHDLAMMTRFAAHVVLLDGGRVAASGPPHMILTPARLAATYGITASTVDGMLVPTGRV